MNGSLLERLSWLATTLVLLLIFIGGLVRATGAGLGCPDWPRCWGSWWPPASAEEIRLEKLHREKIPAEFRDAPDPRVFFNKEKMWIEYLNRLWGVLSGLAVVAMVVAAIPRLWDRQRVFWTALLALLLMLLQGWLGALVVRSGLEQGMITIHMALALVILAVLIHVHDLASGEPRETAGLEDLERRRLRGLATATLVLTLVQVIAGTHVREVLDSVADARPDLARGEWIHHVGWTDHFHRAFSWTVLATSGMLAWRARRAAAPLRMRSLVILGCVLLQLALGVSLAYAGLPPASQFLHLGVAALLSASLFRFLLVTRPAATGLGATQPASVPNLP